MLLGQLSALDPPPSGLKRWPQGGGLCSGERREFSLLPERRKKRVKPGVIQIIREELLESYWRVQGGRERALLPPEQLGCAALSMCTRSFRCLMITSG